MAAQAGTVRQREGQQVLCGGVSLSELNGTSNSAPMQPSISIDGNRLAREGLEGTRFMNRLQQRQQARNAHGGLPEANGRPERVAEMDNDDQIRPDMLHTV